MRRRLEQDFLGREKEIKALGAPVLTRGIYHVLLSPPRAHTRSPAHAPPRLAGKGKTVGITRVEMQEERTKPAARRSGESHKDAPIPAHFPTPLPDLLLPQPPAPGNPSRHRRRLVLLRPIPHQHPAPAAASFMANADPNSAAFLVDLLAEESVTEPPPLQEGAAEPETEFVPVQGANVEVIMVGGLPMEVEPMSPDWPFPQPASLQEPPRALGSPSHKRRLSDDLGLCLLACCSLFFRSVA